MAVRLDADALLASVGQDLAKSGQEHLAQGRIRGLGAEDGGAVAVALAALAEEFTFSSIQSRKRDADPAEQRFADIARALSSRKLIGLVARQAVADQHFAALLLASAGQLPPLGPAEIQAARRMVSATAEVPSGSHRWDLHDIVKAGAAMLAELELLCVRPPTEELLGVVEEEIGSALAELIGNAHEDTFLDVPGRYGDVLGAEGLAEFAALR